MLYNAVLPALAGKGMEILPTPLIPVCFSIVKYKVEDVFSLLHTSFLLTHTIHIIPSAHIYWESESFPPSPSSSGLKFVFQENGKLQTVTDLGCVTLKKRGMVTSLYPVWSKFFATL